MSREVEKEVILDQVSMRYSISNSRVCHVDSIVVKIERNIGNVYAQHLLQRLVLVSSLSL